MKIFNVYIYISNSELLCFFIDKIIIIKLIRLCSNFEIFKKYFLKRILMVWNNGNLCKFYFKKYIDFELKFKKNFI